MASKQRTPRTDQVHAPDRAAEQRAPELGRGAELDAVGPLFGVEAAAPALAPGGEAERISLALCVVPRAADETAHLVAVVRASALSDERKSEIAHRLEAAQAAADHVSAVVSGAFGTDSPELRSALLDAFRGPVGPAGLEAGVAAAVGQPEGAVRTLCDGLRGWVGWWWDEEEEEEAAPGDYAAEEGGS